MSRYDFRDTSAVVLIGRAADNAANFAMFDSVMQHLPPVVNTVEASDRLTGTWASFALIGDGGDTVKIVNPSLEEPLFYFEEQVRKALPPTE